MGKIYKFKPPEIEEKYDPLNVLPQEILDIIFGYLGVNDLLNLSESSLNWYNTISKSECLKKKAKLVIECESLDANMVKILLNSIREYQNIRIRYQSRSEISTDSKKDIKIILKKFDNSIKSLETPFDIPRVCDMPKLKKFVFDSADCYRPRMIKYYETGLFKKLEKIEELYIRQKIWSDKFIKHLKDILPTMMSLKSLRVTKNILKDAEYSFQLRKFECCIFIEDEDIRFLKSQSASLEVLLIKLLRIDVDEVLSIILTMPNLNTLSLWISSRAKKTTRCLPTNKTIKSFTKLDHLENGAIFDFMENLQVLKVYKFTHSVVNAIPSCPSLRQVHYKFRDYYPSMTPVRQQHPNIEFVEHPSNVFFESFF